MITVGLLQASQTSDARTVERLPVEVLREQDGSSRLQGDQSGLVGTRPGESEGGHGGNPRCLPHDQVPVGSAALAPYRQMQRTQRVAIRLTRLYPPALAPSPARQLRADL